MLRDARQPLPGGLRQRLSAIPRQVVVCRDVDRLYAAARRQAFDGEMEPAAEAHLATCERCRTLYATLGSAFAEMQRPAPPRLAARLRHIGRHPEALLPVWVRDSRYAAAACFLLTVIMMSLAGDASARFRSTTETVSTQAATWTEAGEVRGRAVWGTFTAAVAAGYDDGRRRTEQGFDRSREQLRDAAESSERFVHDVIRDLESTWKHQQETDNEGDPDGP